MDDHTLASMLQTFGTFAPLVAILVAEGRAARRALERIATRLEEAQYVSFPVEAAGKPRRPVCEV